MIAELRKDQRQFRAWLEHVRTALEDIRDIQTIERPEDKHCYVVIEYANRAKIPSWLASDGTLRLLTLTIPAYLKDLEGTFLIEEPENGVHPAPSRQSCSRCLPCMTARCWSRPIAR